MWGGGGGALVWGTKSTSKRLILTERETWRGIVDTRGGGLYPWEHASLKTLFLSDLPLRMAMEGR